MALKWQWERAQQPEWPMTMPGSRIRPPNRSGAATVVAMSASSLSDLAWNFS